MKVIGWPPSASWTHINAETAQSEQKICAALRKNPAPAVKLDLSFNQFCQSLNHEIPAGNRSTGIYLARTSGIFGKLPVRRLGRLEDFCLIFPMNCGTLGWPRRTLGYCGISTVTFKLEYQAATLAMSSSVRLPAMIDICGSLRSPFLKACSCFMM